MTMRLALLTAARDEALWLPAAIEAVVGQSLRPAVWVIVDDGSTDATGEIIARAARAHPFIRPLSTAHAGPRCFGSKDRAIHAAYASLRDEAFDLVAVQDADITPAGADLYRTLSDEFEHRARLGLAGGAIHERLGTAWAARSSNSADSVAGGLQMFRRACYEQIGGYTPLVMGGEDWLAQLDARRAGWAVLVREDQILHHHRETASAGGRLRGHWRLGRMDASFGSDALFEVFKCARRLAVPPVVLGGLLRLAGYAWARLARRPLAIAPEQAAFLRQEQRAKLQRWLGRARGDATGRST